MYTARQTADTLLMIRPAHFGYNAQTAASNSFQTAADAAQAAAISQQAVAEFDQLVQRLRQHGVTVIVVGDTPEPVKPDAVFPNNWVSFHHDGKVILYPMMAPSRRTERRTDIVDSLAKQYHIVRTIDWSSYESKGEFLEGTGSMIFDRPNRLAYACVSPRTHVSLLEAFCRDMQYQPIAFDSYDRQGQPIYHTNVMMSVGETFVVICTETVRSAAHMQLLYDTFRRTGKEIIQISLEQMEQFAGNMLQVRNSQDDTFLVMSERAYKSLEPTQVAQIQRHTRILHSPLNTIETYGGGSARCMMAEVFLQRKQV